MVVPTLRYREFAPPARLAALARCVWTVDGDAGGGTTQRVLPDGCCDLLLDGPRHAIGLHWIGPQRRALVLEHRGPLRAAGLRLRPGAAAVLIGLPAAEIADGMLRLDDHAPPPWSLLRDRLRDTPSPGALGRALHALAPRIAARADGDTFAWIAWLERLRALPLQRVRNLADETGLTTRTLERRMQMTVGLSPREFLAGLRFERALARLRAANGDSLADIATDCGYVDQSHLTRECRRFAGLTPTALRATPRPVDDGAVAFVQDARAWRRDTDATHGRRAP
jgi:AraC-like DNA-binding protein